jgi:pimeloyl-ACP methyl ester carboxylesterase
MLLAGRERTFLAEYAIPSLNETPDAFTDADIDTLARSDARHGGFDGAAGWYRSALTEADEIRDLAARGTLAMPVLTIGGGSADFTPTTMRAVATNVTAATLPGIGYYVAREAPDQLAEALRSFYSKVDRLESTSPLAIQTG